MFNRILTGLTFVVFLAIPCLAQTDQNPPPPSTDSGTAAPAPNPATTPPKKVWTNDDLHGRTGVSVVGDKRSQNYHMSPAQTADPATVSRIRKSLEKLNAQLHETNSKLAELRNFQSGENVNDGGRQINKGLNRVPVDQQIAQLESSKKKLEGQIGDLQDEARKKGIDPGQLR